MVLSTVSDSNMSIHIPDIPKSPSTKLNDGDVIAFSISPAATAAEYDNPRLLSLLQRRSYGKYLGIVYSPRIRKNPAVLEGTAAPNAPTEVEFFRIAYIGSTPPDNSISNTTHAESARFLPNGSFAFACIPLVTPSVVKTVPSYHPPLALVGNGKLPIHTAYVYTAHNTSAHLDSLWGGSTALRLANGEGKKLSKARAADTTSFTNAASQYRKLKQGSQICTTVSFEELRAGNEASTQTDGGEDEDDAELYVDHPPFTNAVVDVWTDFTNIGPVGEPVDFKAELTAIERAISESYKEEPQAVDRWAENVQHETTEQSKPAETSYSVPAVFSLGFIFGFGFCIVSGYVFRYYKRR